MTTPFIEYRGLEKSFGPKRVLDGVDLTVNQGETMVILGGSGTGKSVLLKLTIGLMATDSGRILVEGEDVTDFEEKAWYPIRNRISYMFQWGALFDSMSVFENVAFPLKERGGVPEEEIAKRVGEKLALVGLADTEALFPADLSGGMRKRVALARSTIFEPQCILYDEPTAGLDPITSDTINRLIRRMQKVLGVTSIVVTHDINSMFHVADRVAFLWKGKMAFVGTPDEARNSDHPTLRGFIEGRNPDEHDP
jgi:phospholipid/cholesterol/gamma-HCH transport system ATP-binding protein